ADRLVAPAGPRARGGGGSASRAVQRWPSMTRRRRDRPVLLDLAACRMASHRAVRRGRQVVSWYSTTVVRLIPRACVPASLVGRADEHLLTALIGDHSGYGLVVLMRRATELALHRFPPLVRSPAVFRAAAMVCKEAPAESNWCA